MPFRRIAARALYSSGNLMIDKANQLSFMLLAMMVIYAVLFSVIDVNLGYIESALTNLSMLPVSLAALWLLRHRQQRTAKIMAILYADFIIAANCYLYAPDSFVGFFFFPIIICSLVILPGKDKPIGYLLVAFTFVLFCGLLLHDFHGGLYNLSPEELRVQWIVNSIAAAGLTVLVVIFILTVNQQIQAELSLQTEAATRKNETLELNIRTKNRLFSIISHDLRNPLITIRGAVEVLNMDPNNDEKKRHLLPELSRRLDTTMVLMDNLLMWSRTQLDGIVYQPEVIDPNLVMKGVIRQLEMQADEKKLLIILHSPMSVPVHADKNMFELIFRNLINNAIKFTHPEGYVKISIEKHRNKAHIIVSDSGTGMSPATLQRLRQKEFFSTPGTKNEKGTGLGLVLCHEFVNRHGGELIIDSQLQAGSAITVILDAYEPD